MNLLQLKRRLQQVQSQIDQFDWLTTDPAESQRLEKLLAEAIQLRAQIKKLAPKEPQMSKYVTTASVAENISIAITAASDPATAKKRKQLMEKRKDLIDQIKNFYKRFAEAKASAQRARSSGRYDNSAKKAYQATTEKLKKQKQSLLDQKKRINEQLRNLRGK